MKIDIKILEELKRYNSINSYINEQDAALPPNPDALAPTGEELPLLPPAPETPTGETSTPPVPVDVKNDPDVEKLDGDSDKKEELDITDLVKSQKNVEEKQEEYFQNLFILSISNTLSLFFIYLFILQNYCIMCNILYYCYSLNH